jgi:Putative Flp pilus-assembly TadE/G-like
MIAKRTTSRLREGVALVKVLLCLVVLVGILALNLDGGRTMDERRRAQTAADAAALAASAELYRQYWSAHGGDPSGAARDAARDVAAANGYPTSAVTVHIPPVGGTYAGRAGYAEVEIANDLDVSFGRVFTGDPIRVKARSVARGEPVPIGIILLNNSGAAAFDNSAAAFVLVNKPLIVNSADPIALRSTGLTIVGLTRIDVTGGANITSLLPLACHVRTGVRPTLDPLAFLPVPSTVGVPVRSATPLTINSLLPTILQPGVYRGGIRATGLSIVVMNPGVYIMEGGGFRVDGAATVTGLGTMVYNTTSPSHAPGPISVAGLGKVVMTAPLSGTYQGINFFQHRALTQPVTMTGLGLTTITGVVYAAKAPVNLTGSAAVGLDILGGAYVADTMTVTGVGAVTVNLGLNPPRIPDVRVVE